MRYEFLLPLTHENHLRKALDDLFYVDTIRQRLAEIGMTRLTTWIERDSGESEESYMDRVHKFISDHFGGYSISHVSGRYRAAPLMSRAKAAEKLVADERYLIDETTASVRFIIPIGLTRTEDEQSIDVVSLDETPLDPVVVEEVSRVHSLFFSLFVEAVVRTVDGEDEIWLVEEVGRNRSLYVWERV